MEKQKASNKERAFGLYNLAFRRIEECQKHRDVIPFPEIFEALCRSFSIKKKEAWELLYILRDFQLIELKPYHGVVVK